MYTLPPRIRRARGRRHSVATTLALTASTAGGMYPRSIQTNMTTAHAQTLCWRAERGATACDNVGGVYSPFRRIGCVARNSVDGTMTCGGVNDLPAPPPPPAWTARQAAAAIERIAHSGVETWMRGADWRAKDLPPASVLNAGRLLLPPNGVAKMTSLDGRRATAPDGRRANLLPPPDSTMPPA